MLPIKFIWLRPLALLFLLFNINLAQNIVTTLPGYQGILPFKLETGYLGVGDNDEVQLFYYFIESEGDPGRDPLVLWLTGGPGCSAFSGLVYEVGPLVFDYEAFDGSSPSFLLNPYAWTKIANIIFLDLPVGTGFSYSSTFEGYYSSDTKSAKDAYMFLQKLAKSSCNEVYVNPDQNNTECLLALQLVKQCISNLRQGHILEPKCNVGAPKPDELKWNETYLEEDSIDILLPSNQERPWCRSDNYVLSSVWANDPTVREALHVRNGTKQKWRRCNRSLSYDEDVATVFHYHQVLSRKNLKALIYSGDHDLLIPHIGTLEWIKDLNLTLDDDWRPWFLNGQVAGYTLRYTYGVDLFSATFATVKGAGHTAPEYKPKECFSMIERWLSYYPL